MININEENKVDGRELYTFLEIKTKFATWITRGIEEYDFEIEKDYTTKYYDIKDNELFDDPKPHRIEYYLTIDCAIELCMGIKKNPLSKNILKFLFNLKNGNEINLKINDYRKEIKFGIDIIYNLFSNYKIYEQYPVYGGTYRVDWYIPELNLAIEYDELHHIYNKEQDEERQKIIEKELKCKFIRYTEISKS